MEKIAFVFVVVASMLLAVAADLPLAGCYNQERWSIERGARVEASVEEVIFNGPGKALISWSEPPEGTTNAC